MQAFAASNPPTLSNDMPVAELRTFLEMMGTREDVQVRSSRRPAFRQVLSLLPTSSCNLPPDHMRAQVISDVV
eukprot:scaffold71209_cov16-Tisochrysis_lutea.AAC.2